jgi:hypothetical protein
MDCICSDEGVRSARFTLACSGKVVAEFDSTDDVHDYVRKHPDASYTIYPGQGVSLHSQEMEELNRYWRWWEPAEKLEKFEKHLADEWAIERGDVYVEGMILASDRLRVMVPVRPETAMKALKVGETRLLNLLRSGRLSRPKKLDDKSVAWRWDEIAVLAEHLKAERE